MSSSRVYVWLAVVAMLAGGSAAVYTGRLYVSPSVGDPPPAGSRASGASAHRSTMSGDAAAEAGIGRARVVNGEVASIGDSLARPVAFGGNSGNPGSGPPSDPGIARDRAATDWSRRFRLTIPTAPLVPVHM